MANVATQNSPPGFELQERRREAMAVLSCSTAAEIGRRLAMLGAIPTYTELRSPQNGLVMLRGRIGGDGAPFNFGEATVSRAAVRLATGETGIGYTLGRDLEKSRLIALCDALVQHEQHRHAIEQHVLGPIRADLKVKRDSVASQVAATKVEFFTLARGED